jgi:hypothetical protein
MSSAGLVLREPVQDDAERCAAIYAPYVRNTAISFETEPPTPGRWPGGSPTHLSRRWPAAVRWRARALCSALFDRLAGRGIRTPWPGSSCPTRPVRACTVRWGSNRRARTAGSAGALEPEDR